MRSLACIVSVLATLVASRVAAQEELPSAAVLETQAGSGVPEGTGGALDRMVRARLDQLDVVRTSSGVSLDLSEVQLALGCVGETVECLGPVAQELDVRLLLIPHLDQTDGELMLTIALFDRQEGTVERALRRASGENARTDLLDSVEGLLRELFGLPPPAEGAPRDGERGGRGGSRTGAGGGGLSPWSFVVMGVGVAALGTGIGFGVAFQEQDERWQDLMTPASEEEADVALKVAARADRYAIAANVLFAAGGVLIGAGLIWMIVELTSGGGGSSETALLPLVGPNTIGLAAQGRWEAP